MTFIMTISDKNMTKINDCNIPVYLAPMEEVTGYVFRNTLEEIYGGVDKYFTPFVSPNQNKIMKTKDGREMSLEHNSGKNVVIQIMSVSSKETLKLIDLLVSLGYGEINFNFGCPSNTVVKKYRGSGIFRDLSIPDSFLDSVFEGTRKYTNLKISVKTRVGLNDTDLLPDVINIYNKYPLSELIVHPRIQKDFYKGEPNMEAFDYCYKNAKMPVCYNGNIFSKEDYFKIVGQYPNLSGVMIGRGGVANPAIFREIKGEEVTVKVNEFQQSLCNLYFKEFGENDGVCKMKEFWTYYRNNYNMTNRDYLTLMKSKSPAEYTAAVSIIKNTLR